MIENIQSQIEEQALNASAKIVATKEAGKDRANVKADGNLLNVLALSAAIVTSVSDKIINNADIKLYLAYKNMLMTIFDERIADIIGPDAESEDDADNEDMSDPDNMERLLSAMFGISEE